MRALRQTALVIALGGLSTLFAVSPSYAEGGGGDGIENIVLTSRTVTRGAGGGGGPAVWSNGTGTLVPKGDGGYRVVYVGTPNGHAGRDGVVMLGGGTADDGPSTGILPAATTARAAR